MARDGRLESFKIPRGGSTRRAASSSTSTSPGRTAWSSATRCADVRRKLGAQLAREAPAAADIVVPVPDSGLFAALGYSRESGLPFEFGLTRNHYVGRTFIEPKQSIRNFGVKVKLNPVRELIAGQAGRADRRLDRARHDLAQDRAHGARSGRRRGPPADLVAAHRLALLLRHRHAAAQRADRRAATRSRRSASSSRPTASPTSRSRGCSPASRGPRASYCTACWTRRLRGPDRRRGPPPGRAVSGRRRAGTALDRTAAVGVDRLRNAPVAAPFERREGGAQGGAEAGLLLAIGGQDGTGSSRSAVHRRRFERAAVGVGERFRGRSASDCGGIEEFRAAVGGTLDSRAPRHGRIAAT